MINSSISLRIFPALKPKKDNSVFELRKVVKILFCAVLTNNFQGLNNQIPLGYSFTGGQYACTVTIRLLKEENAHNIN